MSIHIERENDQKTFNLKNNNTPFQGISNHNDYEDTSESIGLDFLANNDKRNVVAEESEDEEESEEEEDHMLNADYSMGNNNDVSPAVSMTYEEIQHKKAFFLGQLKRLEKKGHVSSRRFGPEHSMEEIEGEVLRIKKEIEIDSGIEYCKQGLVFFANTIEMANKSFDPVGAKLDGWSNLIMNTRDDYDEVFEELYEKYGSKVSMGPEMKLISMVAGSAFMFHYQKSMVDKAMNSVNVSESMKKTKDKFDSQMRGPSVSDEQMLQSLAESDSDVSDVSSDSSEESVQEKIINIPAPTKKGRGRPKKN
jgi:uncharacterized membrane-anchored protein YhcB (DUF1043 family)